MLEAARSAQHAVLVAARSAQHAVLVAARSAQHAVLPEAALQPSALPVLAHQVPEWLDAVSLGAAVQLRPVAVAHVVGAVSW
ncbi:MAG: hypothetical protein ACI9BK_001827 [Acidimicrobiales bacterium]